jgi:hypothetical protein
MVDFKMEELFSLLLGWAIVFSGYSIPDTLPEIIFLKQREVSTLLCDSENACKYFVLGGYNPDTGKIIIDRRCNTKNDIYCKGLIVHEMVHYLQDINNKLDLKNCGRRRWAEAQAYYVQNKFLKAHGVKTNMPYMSAIKTVPCEV